MTRFSPAPITRLALTLPLLFGAIATQVGTALADPLNPLDFPSLGTQTIAAGTYTLNTDTLTFGPFAGMLSSAGGGLGIAVFNFDLLTVDAGAVINVVGSRPLALLAMDTLSFAGTINANGGNGAEVSAPLSGALGGIGVAGGGNGGRGGFTGKWRSLR